MRVWRWPCVAREAPAVEEIETHASHVSCVRFAPETVASAPANAERWLVSTGGADRAALQWALAGKENENRRPGGIAVGGGARDGATDASESDPVVARGASGETDGGVPGDDGEREGGPPTAPPRTNARVGAYRRDALEALETRVSSLLSAARPRPPARRVRPWTKKPSIEVRARDAGRIHLGPRRPDTPPDTGEVLEYADGEYAWVEPTKLDRPS